MHKMLIRLEPSFIESAEKLNDRFSEQDREEISQAIEANYEKIRLIMLEQEKSKDNSKPTLLELGNIGSRFLHLVFIITKMWMMYQSVLEN
jgi:hypothetical protein